MTQPRWWHGDAGTVVCELCPRQCHLKECQQGPCQGRECRNGEMHLVAPGRTSGFCADPIEKKPLYHFLPGSRVLSFGTLGCNLACRFCQNWQLSAAKNQERLEPEGHAPDAIARMALQTDCASVAFTYNDPAVFAEFAIEVAQACHARNLRTVAVTAGYFQPPARADFFGEMDAANVDLKAFSEDFYREQCGARLRPVLDTLAWIRQEGHTWLELTTLLIPGLNDGSAELTELCRWVQHELGAETPLHFSAFHPDHRMLDRPPTPLSTLRRARDIARDAGLDHVYLGNVRDEEGSTTHCANCGEPLIAREGFRLSRLNLGVLGRCPKCGAALAGHFS